MNRTEAVEKIQRLLGFRSDLNSAIIAEINEALTRLNLSATKPWFLVNDGTQIFTVANDAYIDLPEDFIEEWDEGGLLCGLSDEFQHQVIKGDADELFALFQLEVAGTGVPVAYSLRDDRIRLYPTPDDVYIMVLSYHAKDTALTEGSSTNGYLTHIPELVIGMAGLRVAQAVRDKDAIAIFSKMEADARVELYRQNESRKAANATYQIGGPE